VEAAAALKWRIETMPKSTKGTKNVKKRTKVKDLGRSKQELTPEEAKKVKGGMDPTNATPSPLSLNVNTRFQKV